MQTKNDAGATPPASDWQDPDDAPELTEEFFAKAEHYKGDTFVRRSRGRPPTGNAKELVSLRLDQDVLAKLRERGPGWQTEVNELLKWALADAVVVGLNRPAIFARRDQTITEIANLQPMSVGGGV